MTVAGRIRQEGVVVLEQTGDREHILRFDGEGRWSTLTTPTGFAHRTVDGRVVRRTSSGAVDLPDDEADRAHEAARAFARGLAVSHAQVRGGSEVDLRERLAQVDAWTPDRHRAESERFAAAYPERVLILPPDRYRDVVVQPATGCPNAGCTFCAFYRGARFAVAERSEFAAHLRRVRELFGAALPGRDGVFLGSASALSIPDIRLLEMLEDVEVVFGRRKRGVAGFLDPDRAPRRGPDAWRRLAEAGVSRVILGLETGDASLRDRLGKSGDVDAFVDRVVAAKNGPTVGITVLAGPGGLEARERHEAATADAIGRMGLDRGDLVYVSPWARSMPPDALDAATASLRARLRGATSAKVAHYRIEQFRYYA